MLAVIGLLAVPAWAPLQEEADPAPNKPPKPLRVLVREPLVPEGEPADIVSNDPAVWADTNPVRSLVFGQDGRVLASAFEGGVAFWDVATAKELHLFELPENDVPLALSSDGQVLVLATRDGSLRLLQGSAHERLRGMFYYALSIAFYLGGRWIERPPIHVWEERTATTMRAFGSRRSPVVSAAVHSGIQRLVVSLEDGALGMWDLSTGNRLGALNGPGQAVLSLAFAPDGRLLAAGTSNGEVMLWNMEQEAGPAQLAKQVLFPAAASISALAFHPGGQKLALGTKDGTVSIWDRMDESLRVLVRHRQPITSLSFQHSGQTLAVALGDGAIQLVTLGQNRTKPTVLRSTQDGWLSIRPDAQGNLRLLRHDDGSFLRRRTSVQEPWQSIPPPSNTQPVTLAVRVAALTHPGDGPSPFGVMSANYFQQRPNKILIEVTNTGQGRAYWVGAEQVLLPPGLEFMAGNSFLRLDPGETVILDANLSWVSPDDPPVPLDDQLMRIRVLHADGATEPVEVRVDLRAPVLSLGKEPEMSRNSVSFALANTGNYPVALTVITQLVALDGTCPIAEPRNAIAQIAVLDGGTVMRMTSPVVRQLSGRKGRLCVMAISSTPSMSMSGFSRTWRLEAEVSPSRIWPLYLAIALAALVLVAGVVFLRIYRNPVVMRARQQPEAIKRYGLDKLLRVDNLLARANERTSTLTAAGIATGRWELAVAAGNSPEEAIKAVAKAVGGTMSRDLRSESPGRRQLPAHAAARELFLPELRVRFAHDTILAAVSGPGLEDGTARALIEALHQEGQGPRQALVLDLTQNQDARRRLASMATVQIVTLSSDAIRDLLFADEPVRFLESVLVDQIPIVDLSPYQTASGVEQDSLFFGREKELQLMAARSLRSFLLVGARQMGKTSLLQALARRLATRSNVNVRYLSLDRIGDLVGHMTRNLGQSADMNEAVSHPEPTAERDRAEAFRRLAAGTREQPRLWLVDEADMFVKYDTAEGHVITSVMRQLTLDGLAYFVLAGYWELYAATAFDYQHPLLNFAELVRLDPLDEHAARQLATEPITALGLGWDSGETVEYLVQGTGRRANFIVLACKGMLETMARESRVLTREQLGHVVRNDRDLGDALRTDRRLDALDRAVLYQALAMTGQPCFDGVVAALRAHGLAAPVTELERSRERVILAYVLVEDENSRLRCPVPFLEERLRRDGDLAERVRDFIDEWNEQQRRR